MRFFSPFSIYSFFSPLRAYMYTFPSTCIRIQVELVNVHKFVYIKTCIVHDTSSSKTTGTFVVNIAEISLTFSLSLSLFLFSPLFVIFSSNVTWFVEREKEAERMEKKKKEIEGNKISFLLTCICIKVIVSAGTSEILE